MAVRRSLFFFWLRPLRPTHDPFLLLMMRRLVDAVLCEKGEQKQKLELV
jgi:hypothetical protein